MNNMLKTNENTKLAYLINEFAKTSSISRSKIYEEIRNGKLKARKLGSRTIITLSDANAYFDSLPVVTP